MWCLTHLCNVANPPNSPHDPTFFTSSYTLFFLKAIYHLLLSDSSIMSIDYHINVKLKWCWVMIWGASQTMAQGYRLARFSSTKDVVDTNSVNGGIIMVWYISHSACVFIVTIFTKITLKLVDIERLDHDLWITLWSSSNMVDYSESEVTIVCGT
jgi:hypothetical protein